MEANIWELVTTPPIFCLLVQDSVVSHDKVCRKNSPGFRHVVLVDWPNFHAFYFQQHVFFVFVLVIDHQLPLGRPDLHYGLRMKWRCNNCSCNRKLRKFGVKPEKKKEDFRAFNGIRACGLCVRAAHLHFICIPAVHIICFYLSWLTPLFVVIQLSPFFWSLIKSNNPEFKYPIRVREKHYPLVWYTAISIYVVV